MSSLRLTEDPRSTGTAATPVRRLERERALLARHPVARAVGRRCFALWAAGLWLALPAAAAEPRLTFEPPTYVPGNLAGQDEWRAVSYGPAARATVSTNAALAGRQSVLNDAGAGRSDVSRPFPRGQFLNGTRIEYLQQVLSNAASGVGSGLYFGSDPGAGWSPVWVRLLDGQVQAIAQGAAGIEWRPLGVCRVGVVYAVQLTLDFANARYHVLVRQATNAAVVAQGNDLPMYRDRLPDPATDTLGLSLAQGSGSALFDDVRVTPPSFRITEARRQAGSAALTWESRLHPFYAVERSATLVPPAWTVIADALPSAGELTRYTDTNDPAAAGASFYRVRSTEPMGQLRVRLSWGHRSVAETGFIVRLATNDLVVTGLDLVGFEAGDRANAGVLETRSGAGDVDGLEFTLRYPDRAVRPISNVHSLWSYLLAHSDADTASRLQQDPAYRPDTRTVGVQLDADGTRGFMVTVDQLLTQRSFWVPALDVFLEAGEPPVSFAEHQEALRSWAGQRTLDLVRQAPEASYAEYCARWEDMGSAAYQNPAAVWPGHIIGVTWDSALYKFGLDRGAGVWNDYGQLEVFRGWFDFGDLAQLSTQSWRGQRLTDGLPVVVTTFEASGTRYEVEQFAFPLHGPPAERRGDIPMVLLQQVRLTDLTGGARTLEVRYRHHRRLPASPPTTVSVVTNGGALLLRDSAAQRALLVLDGGPVRLQSNTASGVGTNLLTLAVDLPAGGSAAFVVKLPSPVVAPQDHATLLALDYAACRATTLAFWSNTLASGAQFTVPERAVNDLFRANLWHALRLPRRHGTNEPDVRLDLPYSNFAYDQNGTPWPVNQAVYVDFMLYDLRGHHAVAGEELAAIFRNNQEPSGRVGGFANWGVYTPGLIYAVAQHALLSGDTNSFQRLLPATLRALDWCLAELARAASRTGPAQGLVLAPLNDLSHEPQAWAFNQAYFFAGLDALAQALARSQHPRADECRAAAEALYTAVQRAFSHASAQAPLVQLRDHTWMPYVPGDALTPRRLFDKWYPTDVDSGPLHLARLKALDPRGPLTEYLLHDHEDNLFLNHWGMANEPVYNQQATAYLLRDEPEAAIRAFYSMMACAFSHSAFEPVEHRWGWGQYFGPPSTDGAWFELYRNMLLNELPADGTLFIGQAVPRAWLANGKRIAVERAPTYFGPVSFTMESRAAAGEIAVTLDPPTRQRPTALLVRLRHPEKKPLQSVTVNGQAWKDFDAAKEWVRLPSPTEPRYTITVRY